MTCTPSCRAASGCHDVAEASRFMAYGPNWPAMGMLPMSIPAMSIPPWRCDVESVFAIAGSLARAPPAVDNSNMSTATNTDSILARSLMFVFLSQPRDVGPHRGHVARRQVLLV